MNRYRAGDGYPELTMSFSLAGVKDNSTYNALFNKVQMIPGYTIDAREKVTLSITRPANAVHLENVVKRDGSSTLTGDSWDVGGDTWITNVRGLFLENKDGTQYSVASGLTRTVVARHGDRFPIHSCPEGHTPELDVMVKSLQPLSSRNKYGETGSLTPKYSKSGSNWVVSLEYYAKRTSDSSWVKLNDGYLKVQFLCIVT
ncbi:hypothetical protein OH460_27190 [Vibrio sp. Makdt]|uniref:hypothetical protein n=1 Tax=Vibrio sp. Makdt TaxID=2998828 RepID=UPI0022CDA707|nr:hypothetical protein [Vibrio sp. Makdt]MDA0155985.1 hypothetical protein [Vibrio sp. Makdt]